MSVAQQTPNKSASPVPNAKGKKARPLTETEKRIEVLAAKKTMTPAEETELKTLRIQKNQDDLKRLASFRVTKALSVIKQIQVLSRFKPTAEQTKKVFTALRDAVNNAGTAWEGNVETTNDFSL